MMLGDLTGGSEVVAVETEGARKSRMAERSRIGAQFSHIKNLLPQSIK